MVIPKPNSKYHVDEKTWNDEAVELGKAHPGSVQTQAPNFSLIVYCASKTLAERKCWEFAKKQPGLVMNTVNPNFNIGRILEGCESASTGGMIRKAWEDNPEVLVGSMKMMGPQYFVDVQDTARLHVAALMYEDVKSERLLGFSEPFNLTSILAAMKEIDPKHSLPDAPENEDQDLSTVATERAAELLKRFGRPGFTDMQTSIRACVEA